MSVELNLEQGKRAERKALITVAEWQEPTGSGTSTVQRREILGARVEDSSIELNADIQESTDILGNNYTDVNKTQPQQGLDPSFIIGGSKLSAYLYDAVIKNKIQAYTNFFTVYIISAFIGDATSGYEAVKHEDCSIIPTSIGGDAFVAMPLEIHFSNKITSGTVDKLTDDFAFTPDASL